MVSAFKLATAAFEQKSGKIKSVMTKIAAVGFMFFLIKGIIWLIIGAALALGVTK